MKNESLRVLHVVRALDVGGMERVILDLISRSPSFGVQPAIACLYHAGGWGEARCDLAVLEGRSKWRKSFHLARLARSARIQILHSHNPEAHIVSVLAGFWTGIPVLHTKHGRDFPSNRKRVFLNMILNRLSRCVVAVSRDAAAVAHDLEKCPARKLQVIHNGIDVAAYHPVGDHAQQMAVRDRLGIPAGGIVIGSVGRLSWEKDYGMLIGAVAKVVQETRDAGLRLVLVGAGPDRVALEQEAVRLGIHSQCLFAGEQSNVAEWLRAFDVFCLSSRTEGLPISLLEAGACGLPCVVTDVGGNREVVQDGHNGFVVSYRNVDGMAGVIRRICGDSALRQSMGRQARLNVEDRFSLDGTRAAYAKAYREATG